ncbi:uncharacterized protein [Chironomus tepperi]|uniref:uncharacterized protein n=1 Tax=Chironomus tepperi TaxID=113505 RepID=UPI00391EF021
MCYLNIVTRILVLFIMLLTCDQACALSASAINSQSDKSQSSVVEYYKDHEITERQARESLSRMSNDDFQNPTHCKPCTEEHHRYCYSSELLKDHCCCNQSHQKEQLYFIPHECYINYDRCYPSLGSCLQVMNIRSCCCDAQLKKHWRSVLGNANMTKLTLYLWMLPLVVLIATFSS